MTRKARPLALRRGLTDLGNHLSEWRRLLNLTIADLAERSDVSEATISRIESGAGASLENVLRLARAMGIMEELVSSVDPWESDRGKLLIGSHIPKRAEGRK